MTSRRFRPIAIVAALLVPASNVQAFEMLGFKGGMVLQAFIAQARAQGYTLTVSGEAADDLPESAWAGERLLGASLERQTSPSRLVAFLCDGKLKSLSEVADGGVDAFVRDVAAAQNRFSAPGAIGKAVSRPVTPKYFISSLAISWAGGSSVDTYTVELVSASGIMAIHRGWNTRLDGCE